MQKTTVDARGLACPIPVVKTKKAIESAAVGDVILTLVDNDAARDNVSRMAQAAGCSVSVEGATPLITLEIKVGAKPAAAVQPVISCNAAAPTVIAYVNKDLMGHGDETLGRILMKAFVQTLKDVAPRPSKLVFVNSGVHLACEGSPVLETLKELDAAGVSVVSCGTCLDFYKKLDKVRIGVVSNMYEIVTLIAGADRVISP